MANKTINDKLSFSNRFILYVRTGENDAKTLRVDANFLHIYITVNRLLNMSTYGF